MVADGNRLYAGNGDSTLKVIDLDSLTIINSVNTGGTKGVGKMALDSSGHRLLVVNNADTPPFLTLISTKKGNPILFGPATVPVPPVVSSSQCGTRRRSGSTFRFRR